MAATQHARVALDRITRTIYGATANEQFPGCIVVAETINGWRYPDTLVIWRPNGAAANPNGLPRYCELVIYCPHPNNPNQLVEITAPTDTRTVPAVTDTSSWQSEIAAIKIEFSIEGRDSYQSDAVMSDCIYLRFAITRSGAI